MQRSYFGPNLWLHCMVMLKGAVVYVPLGQGPLDMMTYMTVMIKIYKSQEALYNLLLQPIANQYG